MQNIVIIALRDNLVKYKHMNLAVGPSGRVVALITLFFASTLAYIAYIGHPHVIRRVHQVPKTTLLAVLPFENLSGDPDLELIASDITVSMTEALFSVADLHVIPREQSLLFKGSKLGVKEVANQLGVAYVLAGSIEQSGETIEVDAYLIQPETPRLWAESFHWGNEEGASIPQEMAKLIAQLLAMED